KLTGEILERAREESTVIQTRNAECGTRNGSQGSTESRPTGEGAGRGSGVEGTAGRMPGGAFGGLDTGRRCWLVERGVHAADVKRVLRVEQIALGNLVERVTGLFYALGLQALFIDQAPATDEARTLALRLNGLEGLRDWPIAPRDRTGFVSFPS